MYLHIRCFCRHHLWVIHEVKHLTCTCLDFCFIFPSTMRALWNGCLTEIDPVVPTHCCACSPSCNYLPFALPFLSVPLQQSRSTVWHHSFSPLLSPTCILFLSFNIKWRNPPPPHPSRHPSIHTLRLSAGVCLFHVGSRRGKVEVFLYWEIQDLLPALILDNRKTTDCPLFNYWQPCMQRCLQMCGYNSVRTLEEGINQ